jgi:hypothetical protein
MLLFVGLFIALPAATLQAQPELSENMSQGDFALWLIKAIGAQTNLPPAATSEDAIKFLVELGIVPEDGWQKDKPISTKFLAELMGKDESEVSGMSFEELVEAVRSYVSAIFDETRLGIFGAQASGTASVPGRYFFNC